MDAILGLSNLGLETESMADAIDYLKKLTILDPYLLGLINDTLDVSRIEQNGLTLKPQTIFSRDLLNQIVEPIRVLARQKEINFIVDTEKLRTVISIRTHAYSSDFQQSPFQCG